MLNKHKQQPSYIRKDSPKIPASSFIPASLHLVSKGGWRRLSRKAVISQSLEAVASVTARVPVHHSCIALARTILVQPAPDNVDDAENQHDGELLPQHQEISHTSRYLRAHGQL